MTRDKDQASHPAPHRGRVATHEALFSVCGAPLAWIVQLTAAFAFAATPCFAGGERILARDHALAMPLIIGAACLLVALASLWLGFVLLRRTRDEAQGDEHRLFETGHGRTRFLAIWAIAFASVFSTLILINLLALVGFSSCVY